MDCRGAWFPTKDYTADLDLWPECDAPADYTLDAVRWPECHYTTDLQAWPECATLEVGDLGDAPDSSNHSGAVMTAYAPGGGPPGTAANYPTVYDAATGLPVGPKHWQPRSDAWLGPWVTLENDADLMPDEDGLTNLQPPADVPDLDGADDGLLYPVSLPHCQLTVITYTVTVPPGALAVPRFVNVWLDWNRDGDWQDVLRCSDQLAASEWAVQDQVFALGPGVHVLQTPWLLPYNPDPSEPVWMRITLSEQPAPVDQAVDSGADGRGPRDGYERGETEDYYIVPEPSPDYDIYIKDSDVDDGSVPSASPWWSSPDIWARNDGDCTNTVHENPLAGSPTTLCVQVRNRMTTAVNNIAVDVYWANAALALSWPSSWSYVNTVFVANLPGNSTVVKAVPWNVPFITGHFCFLARADSPVQDPIGSGPDTVAPVDRVYNNNNIAQKNLTISSYPEVTECGFYTTTVATDVVFFDVVNNSSNPLSVDIEFSSTDFVTATGTLVVEPGPLWMQWTSLEKFNTLGHTLELADFVAAMRGVSLGAHATSRLTMTVSAELDQKFTISVQELKSSDGTELGGIVYVRDIPSCIYLPLVLRDDP